MEVPFVTWWIWVVGGLVLMALEAFTPAGFYLFFIGLAGIGTGTLSWLGLLPSLFWQGVGTLVMMGVLLLLRRPTLRAFQLTPVSSEQVDSMVGETARAQESLQPGASGRVELRGTTWSARNVGEAPIALGSPCRVARVEGITLEVRS
ncbi:MAG: NfeD family protein [Bryobacterales bacterium]|nr:NfeD family protein [Bryobacterales bacterium]